LERDQSMRVRESKVRWFFHICCFLINLHSFITTRKCFSVNCKRERLVRVGEDGVCLLLWLPSVLLA